MKKLTAVTLATAFVFGIAGLYTQGASAQSHGGGMADQQSGKMGGKKKMGEMGEMGKMGGKKKMGEMGEMGKMEGKEKMGEMGEMGKMGKMGKKHKMGKMGGKGYGAGHHGGGKKEMSKGRGHGRDGGMNLFKRFDADGDGVVTKEEAAKFKPKPIHMVKSLDTDKDGEVTGAEIDTWLDERRKKYMDRFDVNDDGVINQADQTARIEQRFARFDTNKDDKVTKEEFKAVMGEWRQKRAEGLKQLRRDFWGRGAE